LSIVTAYKEHTDEPCHIAKHLFTSTPHPLPEALKAMLLIDARKTFGYALASGRVEDGVYRAEVCMDSGERCLRYWFRVEGSKISSIYVKLVNGTYSQELAPIDIRYALLHLFASHIDEVHRLNFDIRDVGWYAPSPEDLIFAFRALRQLISDAE